MERTVENAHAKINLGLEIARRRADGFHEIYSVFQTLDLHDRLVFEPIEWNKTKILCNEPELPTGKENLVFQAVEVLRQATGVVQGVQVFIEKRIPFGAGLGGGSSDAAATLLGLNRAWSLNLSQTQLQFLSSALGSDVPFFLKRGTAVATGRGERLLYCSWGIDVYYLLVYPGFKISTRWAYQNLGFILTEESKYIKFLSSIKEDSRISPSKLFGCMKNAFLPSVKSIYPEVVGILGAMESSGAVVCSMSGSGSTLYGIFLDRSSVIIASEHLADQGFQVVICRPEA